MKPTFSITNAITAALTRIERARGFLEAASLSKDWVLAMGERALVLEAHHTTHIEGTRLTLDQSELFFRQQAGFIALPISHEGIDQVVDMIGQLRMIIPQPFSSVCQFLPPAGLNAGQGCVRLRNA